MATDTGFGEVRFFDDFTDDAVDTFKWTVNTDSGGTAAITEAENGVMDLYNAGNNGEIESIFGAAIWQPNVQGTIVFEARCALITSTTQGVFIGLTDSNDDDEVPIDLDTGTLTTTATDAVGFVYDSQESTSNWYCCSVKAGADGAQTAAANAPTASTYQTFRIVVESNGNCRYFIDGVEITASGAARSAAITTTVQYSACVARLCSGTAGRVYVDYIYVSGGRA